MGPHDLFRELLDAEFGNERGTTCNDSCKKPNKTIGSNLLPLVPPILRARVCVCFLTQLREIPMVLDVSVSFRCVPFCALFIVACVVNSVQR